MNLINILSILTSFPKNKQQWKIFSAVAGLILILAGVFTFTENMIQFNIDKNITLTSAYNMTPTQLCENNDIFEFKNAAVLAEYATVKNDNSDPTQHYYIIAFFEDENETNAYLASMCLDIKDGKIFESASEQNEGKDIPRISFYAAATAIDQIRSKKIIEYYTESADYYKKNYSNVTDSGLELKYRFNTPEQFDIFQDNVKEDYVGAIKGDLTAAALGIVFLALGLIKRKSTEKRYKKNKVKSKANHSNPHTEPDDNRFSYIYSDDYFNRPDNDYKY